MDFINIRECVSGYNDNGEYIDRKVICEICSTISGDDNLYMHKVTMNFNPKTNVYECPNYEICKQRISGKVIETLIYFNNRDFIYDPEIEQKQATKKVKFAGLNEDGEIPQQDFVSLDFESQDPS